MTPDEEYQRFDWKGWLLNRFVMVPLALVVIALGWNAFVFTHNHGIITGRVVDAKGAPVADADVQLWIFNFATFNTHSTVKTGPDGNFTFQNNPSHNIQLSAEKPGVGRSVRLGIRLYFQSEDFHLKQPLQLTGGA
jgi:hypothetical protein